MRLSRRLPLFIVTGASCVGKSSLCQVLLDNETDYIVMESDILWNDSFNTPEDDYRRYRELWLTVCANISQIGKPVVLCGCAVPKQFEPCRGRALFSEIHYLAAVCTDRELEDRMRNGRGVTDENWISSSLSFNRWLKENADSTTPAITLLDTTHLTRQEAARVADAWIRSRFTLSGF